MRSEKEIREQINLMKMKECTELIGLPVNNDVAISWLEWVLGGEPKENIRICGNCKKEVIRYHNYCWNCGVDLMKFMEVKK